MELSSPETKISENGWLEDDCLLLGWLPGRGYYVRFQGGVIISVNERVKQGPGTMAIGLFSFSISRFKSLGPVEPNFTPKSCAKTRKTGAK